MEHQSPESSLTNPKIRRAKPFERRYALDRKYLHEQMDAWEKELGGMWVAVYEGKRVAVAADEKELFEKVEANGYPKGLVAVAQLGGSLTAPS